MVNRVQKINSHKGVAWRYVPTADNPADLASRGGHVEKADLRWDGPRWLASSELWPVDVLNEPSEESQTEAKLVQKVMGVAVNEENEVEEVLHKFQLQKAVRICAWLRRVARKSLRSRGTPRVLGPFTNEKTTSQLLSLEKQAQKSPEIERDRLSLNLHPNQDRILKCRERIQGEFPVYIPESSMLGLRLVEEAYQETLHGECGATGYWIPKLRQLVKKVRKNCYECKRFQTSPYSNQRIPYTWKPADYPHSRNQPVSSDWYGLRWSNPVSSA